MKKAYLLAALLTAIPHITNAQTDFTAYTPGIYKEGAVYYLPKTGIEVHFTIEKITYTPGVLCRYADRYLRINDVSDVEETYYEIKEVSMTPVSMPDPKKVYHIRFNPHSVAPFVELNEEGVLMSINTISCSEESAQAPEQLAAEPATVDIQSCMTEEILMAGSKAKMAELIAKEIYNIRESRNLLLRGQSEHMPADGAALQIILAELEKQESALTQLFTGSTTTERITQTYQVLPDTEVERMVMGRFSRKLGLLHKDDLGGAPLYIDIKDLNTVAKASVDTTSINVKSKPSKKKPIDQHEGLVYNIPGRASIKIYSNTITYINKMMMLPQFGTTGTLSSSHFSQKGNISVTLDPTTGAILRVEN
ncbi:MAG: DUF4831 family protein [Bacteroidales bacterium]|nr:DUF4831 family protein [Bacteroidales bacterium]